MINYMLLSLSRGTRAAKRYVSVFSNQQCITKNIEYHPVLAVYYSCVSSLLPTQIWLVHVIYFGDGGVGDYKCNSNGFVIDIYSRKCLRFHR